MRPRPRGARSCRARSRLAWPLDAVRLRAPNLGGAGYWGTVVNMGALYTTPTAASGEVLKLHNSAVVASALVLGETPLQAEVDVALPPRHPSRARRRQW
jgi:hypothetical protein